MAGKGDVSVRLTLEGAEEVKLALDNMKKAGDAFFQGFRQGAEQAIPGFGSAFDGVLKKIQNGFREATDYKNRFASGFARMSSDLSRVGDAAFTVAKRVGFIKGAVDGAIISLGLLANKAIDAGDAAERMAERVGFSIQNFTALSGVAGTFDVSQEQLVGSLQRMNLAIDKAAGKTGQFSGSVDDLNNATGDLADTTDNLDLAGSFDKAASSAETVNGQVVKIYRGMQSVNDVASGTGKTTVFEKLGLDVQKLAALTPEQRLFAIADAIEKIQNPAERTSALIQILGRNGAAMVNVLSGGSGSLRKAMDEMEQYGVVLHDADKRVIELGDDSRDKLALAFKGLALQVGLKLAPAFTDLYNTITALIVRFRPFIEQLARIVGLYLQLSVSDIKDVLTFNDGNVSEFNRWMITLRDTIISVANAAENFFYNILVPGFEKARVLADEAAAAINGVFGTDLTGDGILFGTAILQITGGLNLIVSTANLAIGGLNLFLITLDGLLFALRPLAFALGYVGAALAALLGLPAEVGVAIVALIAIAAVKIYQHFDEIKAYAAATWNSIVAEAAPAFGAVGTLAAQSLSAMQINFQQAAADFGKIFSDLAHGDFRGALDEIKSESVDFWTKFTADTLHEVDLINEGLKKIGIDIPATWEAIKAKFFEGTDYIRGLWNDLSNSVSNLWGSAVDFIISSVSRVGAAISGVISYIESAIAKARALFETTSGGGKGYATGGLIYGAGGPTQDNIPIWASPGEFMIRAAAVKRLPLSFLRALNSGRYDLDSLFHRFSNMRFAAGGLVTMPKFSMPALSTGGGSGPSSALTLVLGGESFAGLTGPVGTIERLERAARMKKIRSTGRANPYATR